MSKTAVYSWRVDPELKNMLEQTARTERISVARLLDRIVKDWLHRKDPSEDEDVQRRLHKAARKCFGTIRGGDPNLASQAKKRVRLRIQERYVRKRDH